MTPGELLQYLIDKAHEWIVNQHDLHFPASQGFSEFEKKFLQLYFEHEIDLVRVKTVNAIENPPFYQEIINLGIPKPIDFSQAAGITFIDCILISNQFTHDQQLRTSLLFHEMVHVVQYSLLGARRFAEVYVMGWARNGFDYMNIPLERQAYDLQKYFDQKGEPFSVIQLLRQEIKKFV